MITKALRQFKHNDGSEGFVLAYDIEAIDNLIDDLKECSNCDNSYYIKSALNCELTESKSLECIKEYKYTLYSIKTTKN